VVLLLHGLVVRDQTAFDANPWIDRLLIRGAILRGWRRVDRLVFAGVSVPMPTLAHFEKPIVRDQDACHGYTSNPWRP
jgi:hypothetical protein